MDHKIAIVGATGNVGREMLNILHDKKFKSKNIFPVASSRSAGSKVDFGDEELVVEDIENFDISKVNIALFSAGSSTSEKWAPEFAKKNCIVIDNSSHFRMDDDIPLIVPEVNPEDLKNFKTRNIIANPNCSTIQMLVALKPLHDEFGVDNINVSTYQAVSGSGKDGVEELLQQSSSYIDQRTIEKNVYPKQIAFNAIPFVDCFLDNDYTREEMKMVWETQKILDKSIKVNPTAVRVPVLVGHAESIYIETKKDINIDIAKEVLRNFNGIKLIDDTESIDFPTPFEHGHGTDDVYVGRIRKGLDKNNTLNLWVVADNVRKGAALNSIQIAEYLTRS